MKPFTQLAARAKRDVKVRLSDRHAAFVVHFAPIFEGHFPKPINKESRS